MPMAVTVQNLGSHVLATTSASTANMAADVKKFYQ